MTTPFVSTGEARTHNHVIALDERRVLAIYAYATKATAVVYTIIDGFAYAGVPFFFEIQAPSNQMKACLIDTDTVFVLYYTAVGTALRGTVLSITGNAITQTVASTTLSSSGTVLEMDVCPISSGQVVCVYKLTTNVATILPVAITASLTAGAGIQLSASGHEVKVCTLSQSNVVVALYRDVNDNHYLKAKAYSVTSNVLTAGGTATLSEYAKLQDAVTLDSWAILVSFKGGSSFGKVVTVTVAGTVPTMGTPVEFDPVTSGDAAKMVRMVSGVYLWFGFGALYKDVYSNVQGAYAQEFTFASYTPTIGTKTPMPPFVPLTTNGVAAASYDRCRAFVMIIDTATSITHWVLWETPDVMLNIIGISKENKNAGEACAVSLGPVTPGLSGLTTGAMYYVDWAGHLSKTDTKYARIGTAISTTELRQTIEFL